MEFLQSDGAILYCCLVATVDRKGPIHDGYFQELFVTTGFTVIAIMVAISKLDVSEIQ